MCPRSTNHAMLRKITKYFGHLDKTLVTRPSNGLRGFAFNEFDFVYNIEVGKRTTKRIHKKTIATQTDDMTTAPNSQPQLSPSIFSKEFRMLK